MVYFFDPWRKQFTVCLQVIRRMTKLQDKKVMQLTKNNIPE